MDLGKSHEFQTPSLNGDHRTTRQKQASRIGTVPDFIQRIDPQDIGRASRVACNSQTAARRETEGEMMAKNLFTDQIEAETKLLIDGVRIHWSQAEDFKKLRRVLGLEPAEAKELIERYETIECVLAQASVGQIVPVEIGRLVNEKWNKLAAE